MRLLEHVTRQNMVSVLFRPIFSEVEALSKIADVFGPTMKREISGAAELTDETWDI
jgi:hypothetical protein